MVIIVNDNETEVTDDMSVTQLLKKQGLESLSGLAVAINEKIVTQKSWTSTYLQEQDKVLIISATAGG